MHFSCALSDVQTLPPPTAHKTAARDALKRRALELYGKGEPLTLISQKLSMPMRTLKRALRAAGIPPAKRGRPASREELF